MSKINELKAKLSERLNALKAKFFKTKPGDPAAPPAQTSIGMVEKVRRAWREGSTGTRLLLTVMFLTFSIAGYSFVRLTLRMVEHRHRIQGLFHKGTERYDKMEDFLKRQTEMKHDTASVVSIDKVRLNATLDNGKTAFLSISIYVKCDSPKTAKYVENIYPKLHDAILSRVQNVNEDQVTNEAGKEKLKEEMRQAMNAALGAGSIEEVHFFNMVFE